MRRWILLPVLILALLGSAAIAFAQDATPTPAAGGTVPMTTPEASDDSGAAATTGAEVSVTGAISVDVPLTDDLPSAYVSLDLAAGFPLDPFFVSVNGGGDTDAATLDAACAGQISEQPVLTVNWTGETAQATIFTFSDHDPSLVVQLPDGAYVCAQDTNALVQDAQVVLDAPVSGQYKIWVGNEDMDGLIPTVLVLTTRDDVSVGGFQLAGLVQRPQLPERVAEAIDNMPDAAVVQSALQATLAKAAPGQAVAPGDTLTATTVVTGLLPGFVWPVSPLSPDPVCTGLSNAQGGLVFSVDENTGPLRIFAEADEDTALLVLLPDGSFACVDDTALVDGEATPNLNPLIELSEPPVGNYSVLVARIASDNAVEAQVTVTTDLAAGPALLAPADATSVSE